MLMIKPHCGSHHVRGKAKAFPYYVCSVFKQHKCKNGKIVWKNTGHSTYPRRSFGLCVQDGYELAKEYEKSGKEIDVDDRYGSLHNQPVEDKLIGV